MPENEYWPFRDLDHVVSFYTTLFGTWALCATILVGLADWQGRNRLLWGFLGLLLGPFALGLFFFFRKKKEKNNKAVEGKENNQKVSSDTAK